MLKGFDTFREIGSFEVRQLTQEEPSCFNGIVRVEKYRVKIEKVEEHVCVIRARLQKLWDECKNHHHQATLIRAGLKYGIDLRNPTNSGIGGVPENPK
jgi:hypothetical protein